MKHPRFYLSTLLLLCIFAGALIGLWIRRDVWQIHYSAKMSDENLGFLEVCRRHAPWVLGTESQMGLSQTIINLSRDSEEMVETDKNRLSVYVSLHYIPTSRSRPEYGKKLLSESEIQWWVYSADKNYLAIVSAYQLTVYYRTRSYGWTGFLELPLFWVAAFSFLAMVTGFVRQVLGRLGLQAGRPHPNAHP